MDAALYSELLPLLDSPLKQGSVTLSYCPAHNDGAKHSRSGAAGGGRSLQLDANKGLRCVSHSCEFKAILDALRARGGKTPAPKAAYQDRGLPSAVYEFRDPATDDLVAVHGRWQWADATKPKGYDKTLGWRLPDGDYKDGLRGLPVADLPLYRAGAVAMADPGAVVYWAEGEEAVHALERAGQVAITSGGGSSSTAFNRGQLDVLYDRDVVVWADADDPGRKYGHAVVEQLREVARRVAYWEPKGMEKGGDAVDFFRAKRSLGEFSWPAVAGLSTLDVAPDQSVTAIRTIGFYQITFKAADIRREKTGVHAVITIRTRSGLLAASNFNVERDEERVRLANSAHGQLAEQIATAYSKAELKRNLDAFCVGLWDALQGGIDIGLMEGDPDIPAPAMVLKPYIIHGGGTILFGPPGKGKSTMAMLMATSIQQGVYDLWEVEPQPVIYINLERSKISMQRRQARVNTLLGLPPRASVHFLHGRGKTLFEAASGIETYCRRHGIKVGVLDSISRGGNGDMNGNQEMNRLIDVMNGLFETWLAIGHTARGDDGHVFGSQMQDAGMDIGVQLISERSATARLGIGLQVTKSNDTGIPSQEVWSLAYDEGGMTEIRRARNGEFEELEDRAGTDRPAHERIRIALKAGALGFQEIAERTGLAYENVRKAINTHSDQFRAVGKGAAGVTKWGLVAREASPDERGDYWE